MKHTSRIVCSLFLIISLVSCEENNSEKILQSLQGDWVSTVDNTLFISLRDSTFFNGDQYDEFEPLIFRNDSIFTSYGYLYLSDARITDKYMWGYNERLYMEIPSFMTTRVYHNDSIKLKSLEVRFINIWHRGLFDWALYLDKNLDCHMKIVSTRSDNIAIDPLPFFTEGNYDSKLTQADFEFFQEKFRNVPLSKIKKEYESENYDPGGGCVNPGDKSAILFQCEFSVGRTAETRKINFEVRGFYESLPGYLAAFLFHLNKIYDIVEFERTERSFPFKFYTAEYRDYFINKYLTGLPEEHDIPVNSN
jgi:hypothetical protein